MARKERKKKTVRGEEKNTPFEPDEFEFGKDEEENVKKNDSENCDIEPLVDGDAVGEGMEEDKQKLRDEEEKYHKDNDTVPPASESTPEGDGFEFGHNQGMENEDESSMHSRGDISDIKQSFNNMSKEISELKGNCENWSKSMNEVHKLYHNEFAGRLKKMQEELEEYRERDKFRVFDDILNEIIRIYCEHEELLNKAEKIEDEESVKYINNMFADMEELLSDYNIEKIKTQSGEQAKKGCYHINKEIHVDDEKFHNTVAKSISSGFIRANRPIRKEIININKYINDKKNEER